MEWRTTKEQKWRKRKNDLKLWMSKHSFDKTTRDKIIDYMYKSYEADEDVYVETLIPDLPPDLRRAVNRHICLEPLKKVSFITFINLLNNCLSSCPLHGDNVLHFENILIE